jgi:hypothetical protein
MVCGLLSQRRVSSFEVAGGVFDDPAVAADEKDGKGGPESEAGGEQGAGRVYRR